MIANDEDGTAVITVDESFQIQQEAFMFVLGILVHGGVLTQDELLNSLAAASDDAKARNYAAVSWFFGKTMKAIGEPPPSPPALAVIPGGKS